MSIHSFDDYRTIRLKNRIAGWWFTENRTFWKLVVESVGRGKAFSLRVLLRKHIGIETFNLWMVIAGFAGIRVCIAISAFRSDEENFLSHAAEPVPYLSVDTAFLGLYSLFYLFACLWYVIATEFNIGKGFRNVLIRGKSNLLEFMINEEKSFVQSESFVQAAVAPIFCFTLGMVLVWLNVFIGVASYFLVASFFLFIDEALHHRAKIRLRRIMGANEELAKQMMEEYRRRKKKQEEKM